MPTARGAVRGWTVIAMRLIDADNVRDLFDAEFKETRKLILAGETHLDNLAEGFTEADRVIRQMPTVDAVPVVRCEDCKHYRTYMGHNMCAKNVKLLGGREVGLRATGKDDFCNYGERKNDER